jgi:hypothetical protein
MTAVYPAAALQVFCMRVPSSPWLQLLRRATLMRKLINRRAV